MFVRYLPVTVKYRLDFNNHVSVSNFVHLVFYQIIFTEYACVCFLYHSAFYRSPCKLYFVLHKLIIASRWNK